MNLLIKSFFRVISFLFHPLLMPTIGIFIVFNSGTYLQLMPNEQKNFLYTITFLGTFMLPILFISFLYFYKKISSFELDTIKERNIPLLITSAFFFLTFYLVRDLPIAYLFKIFLLSSFVSVMLTMIITSRWKISAHLVGIGGVSALIIGISFRFNLDTQILLFISIIIAGVVGSARLYLKKHNILQVGLGYILGFVATTIILYYY